MESLECHQQILAISRIVDQVADEFLGGDPEWEPLHVVLPLEWCDGFMWMYRVVQDDAVIELYKHGITRSYLCLDQTNRAYRYTDDGYVPIPVVVAVELVFEGLVVRLQNNEAVSPALDAPGCVQNPRSSSRLRLRFSPCQKTPMARRHRAPISQTHH